MCCHSSSGVFFTFASEILKKNGVVFGAMIDADGFVSHTMVDNIKQLECLFGAKYSQSKIGNAYIKAKNCLEEGKYVLFTGTPCQIAGLKKFLSKEYEKLLCMDFICHGIPSPLVWSKYLSEVSQKKIRKINFRSKDTGWSNYRYSLKIVYDDDSSFVQKNNENEFLQGMVKNLYLRPSCSQCKFKGLNHPGDITVGDFWGIWDINPEFDDDKGVSAIIINTNKGSAFLETCIEQMEVVSVDLYDIRKNNVSWCKSVVNSKKRYDFFEEIKATKSFKMAFEEIQHKEIKSISLIDRIYSIKQRFLRR